MKILFLSRWFPYPPNNGSKLRIYNLLRVLSKNHQVTLLSFNDQPEILSPAVDGLSSVCEEVVTIPWKAYQPKSTKALLGFFSKKPRFVIDTFSTEMAEEIRKFLTSFSYDLVIASEIEMASYCDYLDNQVSIFDEVTIGVLYERFKNAEGLASRLRNGLTWYKHRQYLTRILKKFPICTVVSEQEHKLLVENNIRRDAIFVIPNFIVLADYQDFSHLNEKGKSIIFTGPFRYQPNYEAMLWFLEKVFPLILQSDPEIELTITGDHMGFSLPTNSNVTKTGFVDDIRPLIAKAMISIVPLQSGGGTRLKILEAMALCTPVVSTTKGAEGIDVTHLKDILIADDPSDFANAVIRLSQNKGFREQVAHQGLALVEEKYSQKAVEDQFQNILEQVQRKK